MSSGPPSLADPPAGPPEDRLEGVAPVPRWPPWTAPVALIAAFALTLMVGATVVQVILEATGESTRDPPAWTDIVGTLIQDVALVVSAVIFARMTQRPLPRDFGLRPTRWWPALGWTLLTWLSFFVTVALLRAALQVTGDPESGFERLADEKAALAVIGLCLLVTVVAPLAEELFFRGYFFTALRNWKGVWVAAAITGATFGAIHIPSYVDKFTAAAAVAIAGLAVFGAALCLLYWRTGSLLPCFVAHSLNNSAAFGVLEKWEAWQVVLLMLGANLVIAAIALPLSGGRRAPAAA